jgi:hypothetical protein
MITIRSDGRMGNRLQYFIAAMHCHKLTGLKFIPERIQGFLNTYKIKDGITYDDIKPAGELYNSDRENFFENVKNSKNGWCIDFMIHRYECFKQIGRENVIDYLKIENENQFTKPKDDEMVIHIRLGDYIFVGGGSITDKNLYLKALLMENPNRCTIVTDEPYNEYLKDFTKLGCAIRSLDPLSDFVYLKNAKKICISKSSFSWNAAYISNAEKIYFPISDNKWPFYLNPQPDHPEMRPLDLKNWIYI